MKMHTQLIYLSAMLILLLSGCGNMNLKIKPYPKHLGQVNKILYNNKGYWLEDLKDDMNGFNAFEKKTFDSVNALKKRNTIRYGVYKKNKKAKRPKKDNFDNNFYGIIDEQY